MLNAVLEGIAFFVVFGASLYGIYKLMQHNGDIASLKADVAKLKGKL